jgi:8-oxo-dGTP pyrophosphatase MutT (NUDIX family)
MISLDGEYKQMSTQIKDNDGGWWRHMMYGLGVHEHLEHQGKVIPTVDIIVLVNNKLLLIKRGKEPYKGGWALPGGRIE